MDYYLPPQTEYVHYVAVEKPKYEDQLKREVRAAYREVAEANNAKKSCGNGRSCCGVSEKADKDYWQQLGYTDEEIENLPDGCNMGLGCGNPHLMASFHRGEKVLDLGSGGGIDVFLAANRVGPEGKVYGVDMTLEMVLKARSNAAKSGFKNVEFLLGEIEHLPLPNNSIDAIISNCVVNLSTNKENVFKESFRVLKEGGRLAISDIVAFKPLPKEMRDDSELFCNCISGAVTIKDLKVMLAEAGFSNIEIEPEQDSRMFIKEWVPGSDAENYVVSAKIKATKPRLSNNG
ncbi:MAG: arsenite methyltransferase [Chlamydiota bacterium]